MSTPPAAPGSAPPQPIPNLVAGFFNTAWYAERIPEYIAAGWDPLQHFMQRGAAEGRDPNRRFDGAWYAAYYPQAMRPGLSALDHYLRFGAGELRNPHPRFDAVWYVAQHPEAVTNPMIYHLTVGEALGWSTEPPYPLIDAPAHGKPGRVGIGIITFNRKDLLRETVQAVRQYTRRDDVAFAVADDGSTDGTVAMLREQAVPVVTGVNMGVAWNKNRALYMLAQVCDCEAVILLEDDTRPNCPGWEDAWAEAALRWGHVSYAGSWVVPPEATGTGTPADPFLHPGVTAQCTAYARSALAWGGYFDSRFTGYGSEHIEHSRRLIGLGYGGIHPVVDGVEQEVLFAMIRSGVDMRQAGSYFNRPDVDRNDRTLREILGAQHYRLPWRNMTELKQFRSEITGAIDANSGGFGLRRAPEAGRWWRPLFRRRA